MLLHSPHKIQKYLVQSVTVWAVWTVLIVTVSNIVWTEIIFSPEIDIALLFFSSGIAVPKAVEECIAGSSQSTSSLYPYAQAISECSAFVILPVIILVFHESIVWWMKIFYAFFNACGQY